MGATRLASGKDAAKREGAWKVRQAELPRPLR